MLSEERLPDPWSEFVMAHVIRWALATAIRLGEIAGLIWERVNIEPRSTHLSVTKNVSARSGPLSRDVLVVLDSLDRLRARSPDSLVASYTGHFCSLTNEKLPSIVSPRIASGVSGHVHVRE